MTILSHGAVPVEPLPSTVTLQPREETTVDFAVTVDSVQTGTHDQRSPNTIAVTVQGIDSAGRQLNTESA